MEKVAQPKQYSKNEVIFKLLFGFISYFFALVIFHTSDTATAEKLFDSSWFYGLAKPFYYFYDFVFHICFEQHIFALLIVTFIPYIFSNLAKKIVFIKKSNNDQSENREISNIRVVFYLINVFLMPLFLILYFMYCILSLSVMSNIIELKDESVLLFWDFGLSEHVYWLAIGYFLIEIIVGIIKNNNASTKHVLANFLIPPIFIFIIIIYSFLPFAVVMFFIFDKIANKLWDEV
jgi:hypothetical protein